MKRSTAPILRARSERHGDQRHRTCLGISRHGARMGQRAGKGRSITPRVTVAFEGYTKSDRSALAPRTNRR